MIATSRLKKLHRYAGIVLAIFFLFHVINHLCALGGADSHIRVMAIFRKIYRFPPIEGVVLLAAFIQVIVGLVLVWKKRMERNFVEVLQMASGLYLSFFLFYHIRAVMLGRYVWNVETDFHFAAAGLKSSADFYFFLPYYSLSIVSVFIHLACVHHRKMRAPTLGGWHVKYQSMSIVALGAICTGLIMYGLIEN